MGINCKILHLPGNSFPTSSVKTGPSSLLSYYQPHTLTGSLPESNSKDLSSILFLPHPVTTQPLQSGKGPRQSLCTACVHLHHVIHKHRYPGPHTNTLSRGGSRTNLITWALFVPPHKGRSSRAHMCRPETLLTPDQGCSALALSQDCHLGHHIPSAGPKA